MCLYQPAIDNVKLVPVPRKKGKLVIRVLHHEYDHDAKDFDFCRMVELIREAAESTGHTLFGMIEEPPVGRFSRGGSQHSRNSLNQGFALWVAAFAVLSIPLYSVNVASWKSKYKLIKKPKEASLDLVRSMRPDERWDKVDAADAFLIAHFGANYVDFLSKDIRRAK